MMPHLHPCLPWTPPKTEAWRCLLHTPPDPARRLGTIAHEAMKLPGPTLRALHMLTPAVLPSFRLKSCCPALRRALSFATDMSDMRHMGLSLEVHAGMLTGDEPSSCLTLCT